MECDWGKSVVGCWPLMSSSDYISVCSCGASMDNNSDIQNYIHPPVGLSLKKQEEISASDFDRIILM